jgi:hypothetical protein
MDAASLIACLEALERSAGKSGDLVMRDFVIEAQDWVLRTQKENLDLRCENQVLRRRHASLCPEEARPSRKQTAVPPLNLHAIALRNRRRRSNEGPGDEPEVEFARAI